MKIGAISLGCDKNRVDTEKMLSRLVGGGHTLVGSEEEADVIIVNTCAFIDKAKEESIDEILNAIAAKTASKGKKVIVTGCLAQRYADTLKEEFPEVDAILGIADYDKILNTIEDVEEGEKVLCCANAHYALSLRLSQNCRRMQQSLHLLRHSVHKRKVSLRKDARLALRSEKVVRRRRERTHFGCAGRDEIWH